MNSIEELRQLTPYEFEEFVATLWESQGWDTTVRSKSGDRGIDVEARKSDLLDDRLVAIQAKQYGRTNKVSSSEIRTYRTVYDQNDQIDSVVVVTTGEVTQQARKLAEDIDVEVFDGEELVSVMRSAEIDTKRSLTDQGFLTENIETKLKKFRISTRREPVCGYLEPASKWTNNPYLS
jgi:restriction endonuclease Mrr